MNISDPLSPDCLQRFGLDASRAAQLSAQLHSLWSEPQADRRWLRLARELLTLDLPEPLHWHLYQTNYAHWTERVPPPVWVSTDEECRQSNVGQFLADQGMSELSELAHWAQADPLGYWSAFIKRLSIRFRRPPEAVLERTSATDGIRWLPQGRINIVDSCLQHASASLTAADETGRCETMSSGELRMAVLRFAGALRAHGLSPGDAIALVMPLSLEATIAYLGAIAAGVAVVGIAESFANAEIARRVELGKAKLVFVQYVLIRQGKTLSVYERMRSAPLPPMVITRATEQAALRHGDLCWDEFLSHGTPLDEPLECAAEDLTTVLFSSGTTGDPKAIPWTHATPIQCAVDGFLYQDIRSSDVITWPTGMGWMMGPWLLFNGLIHGARTVLFDGHGATTAFVRCVEEQRVTMLGVIPSLVAAWRRSEVWNQADWSHIRLFTTTGECSHPRDMLALMARAAYRPVMEYCGGTELAGGYLGSSLSRPAALSCFNHVAPHVELCLPQEPADPEASRGEAFLKGIAIGFSTRLLNADHHQVYFAHTPSDATGSPLRRHGDVVELLGDGYVRVLGRADDAMNLGGIKISAVELERVCNEHPLVVESAAVAVSDPEGGPARLIVYVVLRTDSNPAVEGVALKHELQTLLRERLSPQFRIHDVQVVPALPRTASNKIIRRELRT